QPGVASRDILGDKSSEAASGSDKTSSPVPASALAAIHDANAETSGQRSGKSGNGAAGVPTGLRLSANLRRASAGERQSEPSLDALWPKGPSRAGEGAPAPIAQNTGVTPTQSQQSTDAPNAPAPSSNPVSAGG